MTLSGFRRRGGGGVFCVELFVNCEQFRCETEENTKTSLLCAQIPNVEALFCGLYRFVSTVFNTFSNLVLFIRI
jgi:hypothetical protein